MSDRRLFSLLAMVAFLLLPEIGFAQVDSAKLARDTHIFRRMFHMEGCKPTALLADIEDHPRETVLVVLGDVSILRSISGTVVDWVRRGGSLLLATDRGNVQDHVMGFGVRLYGGPNSHIRVPQDQGYRDLQDCPFIVPTLAGRELFRNGNDILTRVATNRSGRLGALGNGPLSVVAVFPTNAFVNSPRGEGRQGILLFAAAGEFGAGRALIMADHSVFINAMLWQDDNQNRDFAFNCVDWLTEKGRRKQVFFFDEGIPQNSFEIPLKELPAPPLPPPEALVVAFDQVLAGLERENRFNDLFINLTASNISRERMAALAIVGLSFVMGLFALQRLNSAKHRREFGIVPLASSVAELELGRPIHEQRSAALSERGNYWEAAHELAIDIFQPLLTSTAPGGRLHVAPAGSFWQSWRWRQQVQKVWRVAVDPGPRRWTRRQWLRLLALDERLRREIALGNIARLPESPILSTASQTALPRLHSAR
jgi:hypothetical protein